MEQLRAGSTDGSRTQGVCMKIAKPSFRVVIAVIVSIAAIEPVALAAAGQTHTLAQVLDLTVTVGLLACVAWVARSNDAAGDQRREIVRQIGRLRVADRADDVHDTTVMKELRVLAT